MEDKDMIGNDYGNEPLNWRDVLNLSAALPAPERKTGKVEVEVVTDAYERSHGIRPRGGSGWAFCFSTDGLRADTADSCDSRIYWTGGLSYGESRKLAVAEGKRRAILAGEGFVVVEVMS